jgi:hypothetical protein
MAAAEKVYVFKDAARLTTATVWTIYVLCVLRLLAIIVSLVDVEELQNLSQGATDANLPLLAITQLVNLLFVAIAGILTLVWIYRACANAHALTRQPMEFTPGWAVGWNFVPVATLWKPFQAVREIWNVSRNPGVAEDETPAMLRWWWGLWLAYNVLEQVSQRLMMADSPTIASDVASMLGMASNVGACVLLAMMMRRISAWQTGVGRAEAVFA